MTLYRLSDPYSNVGVLLRNSNTLGVNFSAPTVGVPNAFTVGLWSLTPGAGSLSFDIGSLPSDGGSTITALQYTFDGGTTWTSFVGVGTGVRVVSGLSEVPYTARIRAVNAISGGPASDPKTETPTATGPGTVTALLRVGFVDTSGVPHWDSVTDNVTTITGKAPFFVEFYSGDSYSTHTDSDTPDKAWANLGFLIDYGEGLGGNWSLSGRPKDTDRGMPMAAHTYTVPGTYSARVTRRDANGNQAFIRVNVFVTDPGAGVNMTSGVTPTFASNTTYNAPAGGTWGSLSFTGLHNVIIRKTGAGADPVFGSVTLDGRNEPNSTITRTSGIRFQNCDVASVDWGNVGFDGCAFVGGRVRNLSLAPMEYARDQVIEQSMTALQASNVRMARGLMLQDTGELSDGNGDTYTIFGEMRGLHMKNVLSVKQNGGNHNIRGVYAYSSFRHCTLNNTASGSVSYWKFQGWACTAGVNLPTQKGTPDAWREDGTVVDYPTQRRLAFPSTRVAVVDCQMGLAGGFTPTANAGFGAQNNLPEPAEGCELSGFEHCKWIQTTTWYSIDMTGRGLIVRDCLLNNGAGGAVGVTAGVSHPNRTPDGWAGPYYVGGARPVVVP